MARWIDVLDLALSTPYRGMGEPGSLIGSPVYVGGPPGGGKTAQIRDLCKRRGYFLVELIVSQHDPAELAGVRFCHPMTGEVTDTPAPQARAAIAAAAAGRRVVFFLDELPRGRQESVNAALTLIHDRRAAGVDLPPDTAFVAAGNPAGAGCDGLQWDAALISRFCLLQDTAEDRRAAALAYFDGIAKGACVGAPGAPAGWEAAFRAAALSWTIYMRQGGGLIEKYPAPDGLQDGAGHPLPYPCPRSWEQALRLRATALAAGRDDLAGAAVAGWIGVEAAAGWAAWTSAEGLPLAEDLYHGRAQIPRDPARPDRSIQCVAALLAYVTAAPSLSTRPLLAALLPLAADPHCGELAVACAGTAALALARARGESAAPECLAYLRALAPVAAGAYGRGAAPAGASR